jgi:hypothetical protein
VEEDDVQLTDGHVKEVDLGGRERLVLHGVDGCVCFCSSGCGCAFLQMEWSSDRWLITKGELQSIWRRYSLEIVKYL